MARKLSLYASLGSLARFVRELVFGATMDQPIQQFPTTMPLAECIRDVAPVLNWLIDAFYDGSIRVGVEAFQDDLMNRIEAARCIETCWVDPAKAGVHPSNREEAGLLPVDAQDLLLIFCRNGWVFRCNR